jgi:SAM-dependent methyltransferase
MQQESDRAFRTSYARLYDQLLVPLNFAPYADYLADRVKLLTPRSVLEIAAGTGILTQALTRALPAELPITATDLNEPMIDHARTKPDLAKVAWQQADALQLPFSDESFDMAVCQFGVMFFRDKQQSFREAARVMKPGGHYLFALWDDWTKMPDAPLAVAADTVGKMLGCDPASLLNPPYFDQTTIRADLAAAGLRATSIERVRQPARAASARDAAVATVHGSLIGSTIEGRYPGRLDEATSAVERVLEAKFGDGTITGWNTALIVAAQQG